MRVSHLFGETIREAPAEAETASHQLLVRAGYVRQLATGIFSLLPLGWRAVRKIEQVLREEMDAIGGQELSMPVVHPAEIWKQTGRWQAIDAALVRFQDRTERDLVLAMTHEEVVANLAATEVRSYRQLPQLVYQIQTKFRDEPRARGGLIRVREFVMKDSYSLDRDQAGLEKAYREHYDAYFRIGARVGLPLAAVKSDVGMMGGKVAHEFMYITPIGEDSLAICDCGYAANREVARFRKEAEDNGAPQPTERVATPGAESIEQVAGFLGVPASQTAKAVFYTASYADDRDDRVVMAIVRGDMEINPTQLQNLTGANALRPSQREEIEAIGAVAGYASPIGVDRSRAVVIIDDLVRNSTNLVAGANESGYHLRNVNVPRDYEPDLVGGIAAVYEGAPCIECGAPLRLSRGVEVGNIFQLGTRYSAAMNANFTDEDGVDRPIIMGSYGIGVGRLLACVAEEHRDDRGLALPVSIAPYTVTVVRVGKNDETRAAAESLYRELTDAGVEVLYDDRDASAGVKFADADLRGVPLRITVSDRSLAAGGFELKQRRSPEGRIIPRESALAELRSELEALWSELRAGTEGVPTWEEREERRAG